MIAVSGCSDGNAIGSADRVGLEVTIVGLSLNTPSPGQRWPYTIEIEPFCQLAGSGKTAAPARRPVGLIPPKPLIENENVDDAISPSTPGVGFYKSRAVDGRNCNANENVGLHINVSFKGANIADRPNGMPEDMTRITHVLTDDFRLGAETFRIVVSDGVSIGLDYNVKVIGAERMDQILAQ